ncbi:pyridoxal phosphate biosynthetic protein PdxJ [Paraburkholderia pallida]|uniref:Pyridoxal phosphate biosynthetic protein PdxJ n=1 Tax=Paraburkholderia pallida TaxID=2547399 RepID=A0A4P7CQQ7_9BURK|nr:pyridoxal phosphate biosynthetic protein PdxJ [Paraburkholderia pallida]QBQ98190.1 pyridoxal phosphate biosynthetic protein PdxJ [Paraburkholderia pallida]
MNDKRISPLVLDAMIVTGNTKAAVKAAGGKSADLWMLPYDEIHYDPRDNVRPLDVDWAQRLGKLIAADGYDKSQPLHCYVRKVGGADRVYVWKGQHRYHGIGFAIDAGADLGLIPVVMMDAKSVNRINLIFGGLTSNESKRTSPLELAQNIAELRDVWKVDMKTICNRLQITDQTVRDVALLETAPSALHKLVRDGSVAGTLAIEEIRKYGPDKALERLQRGIEAAKSAGKAKATKKHVDAAAAAPAAKKISEAQAKQLLQALQSVLHDPLFGKLSPGTVEGVHAAVTPLTDLLDALPAKASNRKISTPNEHGVYTRHETIKAPLFKRSGKHPYEIHLAHVDTGKWIFSTSYSIGTGSGSSPCTLRDGDPTYPTRGQAIRAAVMHITREMEDPRKRDAKEAQGVHSWLIKLWQAPDPDWTEELADASGKAPTTAPTALWPFPTGGKP